MGVLSHNGARLVEALESGSQNGHPPQKLPLYIKKYRFLFGSSISLSQSPRRLVPRTVNMIANPGKVANHQA